MATFGDLMSLLVCFFVLLLSFANMDIIKFKRAMGSMSEALGVERKYAGDFDAKSTSPVELSKSPSSANLDITEMQTRPDSATMNQQMLKQIRNTIRTQFPRCNTQVELSGLVDRFSLKPFGDFVNQ